MAKWTLIVSSQTHVDGWLGEAQRLRALLDAVSERVAVQYGGPLVWRSQDMTAEQWEDKNTIASLMETGELRDDFGRIMTGAGSSSVVEGYLSEAAGSIVNAMWTAGRQGNWPFNCSLTFYDVRPLHEHSVDWLVSLVNAAVVATDGHRARIRTPRLSAALVESRPAGRVADITFIPSGINIAFMPETFAVRPGPDSIPESAVVVADLRRAAESPESVVPDLLKIDDLIAALS